ncbi:hypothetical protein LNKW23_48320 [Paralimibaculum aggregatum]|uniref:Polysaccharide biosynthesis protein C-terminal domain-containing protein n=2 Tax=Paralimibaculum aggregatum TaxID=3036245 RepID=A0ABQ6LU45_9RHOB|nr:hypothetical protein LNKW23_48320 [Limibaculum sp. NKW23]
MGLVWVESALSAVYIVVIARVLGAEAYGYWSYALAGYLLVLGLTGFGLDSLMAIRLGAARQDAARYLGAALLLRLAVTGLGVVVLAAYATIAEEDALARFALVLLVPALVGRALSVWARACFLAYERVADYLAVAVALRVADVLFGTLCLLSGGGLMAILSIHAAVWAIEGAVCLGLVHRKLARCAPIWDRREIAGLLGQGSTLGLAAGFGTWLVSGPVILIRHSGIDMAGLGQFSAAWAATMIAVASAQAFLAAALPVLSRSAAGSGRVPARYGPAVMAGSLAAGLIAGAVGWLAGPWLATALLGDGFRRAGELVGPLLVAGALMIGPTGYGQALMIAGRRRAVVVANLAGGAVLAIATVPAVRLAGIEGAVGAVGLAWLARAVVLAWQGSGGPAWRKGS